ncbi:MAG: hypothetical protein GEV12_02845 [Micromonosporaceae bacterium]|nr:hypothetical protein [Micromonosporaceae bacterium]
MGAVSVAAMPSSLHEAFVELFRQRPSLAAELLTGPLKIDLPTFQQARLESGELTEVTPTEYRADAVVVLTESNTPVLGVVVEAQLAKDPGKQWSWPNYLTSLRARLRCPTVLLVICPDPRTARRCATPIELGHPGFVLHPLVLGPDQVPVVTDPAQAGRSPALAVLSAMAHGNHPDRDRILHTLMSVLVDDDHRERYADIVFTALPEAARHYLERLMATETYEYKSDYARRYFSQGEARGEAKALLTLLAARDIPVNDDARTRITECTDLDQLDTWVRHAATATTINDLFD